MKKNTDIAADIYQAGFAALVDSIGVANALRFIQHCGAGRGDYTRDRHQWLDQFTVEEIVKRINARRRAQGEPALKQPASAAPKPRPKLKRSKS